MSEKGMKMKKDSRVETIGKKLSNMIFVTEEFRPGSRLPSERALAEQFSVSRNTIREAVKSLEIKGVLSVRQGSGTYVRELPGVREDSFVFMPMDDKYAQMYDLYELRGILEPETAAIAAERATEEEIKKILYYEQLCSEMITVKKDWMLLDQQFHVAIANATHNEAIKCFIPYIHESAFLGARLVDEFLNINNISEHHSRIAKFIELRDPVGARLAARAHMLTAIRNLETFRQNNMDIFKQE